MRGVEEVRVFEGMREGYFILSCHYYIYALSKFASMPLSTTHLLVVTSLRALTSFGYGRAACAWIPVVFGL